MSPKVSVILPTYNRADTLMRAVNSVLRQGWREVELIVVDDGSTDGTKELLARAAAADPRLRVISQENRGVAAARNAGLGAATGDLLGFMDSDDEAAPHHMALAVAFFEAYPTAHLYSSEFWEDFGRGLVVKHFRPETSEWYPATAAEIGSSAFAGPAPDGDGYRWVYPGREPVGEWGEDIVARSGHRGVFHYRGDIFERWRWGWLMALQPTVITRRALEEIGPFDESIPVASDFEWLARVCRRFEAHFFSLPGTIKHELGDGGAELREGHLATGKTAVQFHEDVLRLHEELFWNHRKDDAELSALRGFRQFLVGQAAAKQGLRDKALEHLAAAARCCPTWQVKELSWLVDKARTPAMVQRAYGLSVLPVRVRSRVRWLRDQVARRTGLRAAEEGPC